MKKLVILFFIFMIVSLLSANDWVSVQSDKIQGIQTSVIGEKDNSTIIQFDINGFFTEGAIINNENHNILRIPNASYILEKGIPELPKYAVSLIIPDNGTMKMRIIDVQYEYFNSEIIIPSKGNLKRDIDPESVPYEYSDIYERDEWYPKNNTNLSEPFILKDYRGVTIMLFPISYNPVKNQLRVIKSITIDVYKSDIGGINTLIRTKNDISSGFKEIYSNFFINYKTQTGDTKYPFLSETVGNMLIISAAGYMDNLTDFIYWKKLKGIPVELIDVNTIGNNSTAIKNYIQNKYDNEGVTWVILVGNGTDVATIAGSYDETCDPVYMYLAGSDNYFDAYISRISGNSEDDIDVQLTKIIEYERYPQDGADWYHKACGTATEEGAPADYERLSWVNDSLLSYTYTTADNFNEAIPSTDADILNAINEGRSILNHIGHGNETGFGTASEFWIDINDIATLTNVDKWPFAYLVACLVGDFDEVTKCCCEAWMWDGTVASPEGAIASYGASVNQSWIPPTHSQLHGVGLLKREEATTIGGIAYNGTMYMQEVDGDLEMLETWHIFGDPSLDLMTDTPDTLDVSHDEFVATGPYSFIVNVDDDNDGTPIEGALVCLWGKEDTLLHETGYTSGGTVSIPINASTVGDTIYVTVTKHNYKPYENYIVVGVGIPTKPELISYFDYARIPILSPVLKFTSTDEDGDDIRYKIFIDTDINFSSPDSFITGTYTENTIVSYTLPVSLTDNTTYFWKVRAQDPSGSGYWSGFGSVRSFTIATILGSDNCSWYQTMADQYNACSLNNLRIIGDSILLNPSYSGVDTLIDADFESGIPSGWTTTSGSSSAVWGTGTGASNAPPSFGASYARIVYPSSGPSPSADTDVLTSRKYALTAGTSVLSFEYGWGMDAAATDEMTCEVIFYNSGWGAWIEVASYTVDGSGTEIIDLSSYLPADSVQVRWSYISPGGRNGQDGAIDNVILIGTYNVVSDYGKLITPPITYADLNNTYPRSVWGYVNWKQNSQSDSILTQLEYCESGVWALIPDIDLSGNSNGFGGSDGNGYSNKSISGLNNSVYDTIRIVFNIYRKSVKNSTEPSISEIEVGSNLASLTNIELINISATQNGNNIIIKWSTENAISGDWIIKRSKNNIDYQVIGKINTIAKEHSYTDKSLPSQSKWYYKIAVVKTDGSISEFGPVKVLAGQSSMIYQLFISGNIMNSETIIKFQLPVKSQVEISIYDISGRQIEVPVNMVKNAGIYNVKIDTEKYCNGTYFIKMISGNFSEIQKILILK